MWLEGCVKRTEGDKAWKVSRFHFSGTLYVLMSLHFHILVSHQRVTTRGPTRSVFFGGYISFSIWVSEWVKVTQSCPTLHDPKDHAIHGILQARTPEWVPFPFDRGSFQPRNQTQVSCIAGGFFTSWATREAQEYCSGYPISSPADCPDPGIEPGSPPLQADSLQLSYQGSPLFHTPLLKFTNFFFFNIYTFGSP